MARSKISASVMAAVLAGLVLTGCDRGGLAESDKRNLDRFTAEEIYKRGEFELENSRKPEDAVFYFSEVERLYPYSEWAKRALIMQAYSNHRAQNYEEARGAAQNLYGQAKDAVRHAADEVADQAGDALEQSRRYAWEGHQASVEWPHASLVVAGLVGFGLGLLVSKI